MSSTRFSSASKVRSCASCSAFALASATCLALASSSAAAIFFIAAVPAANCFAMRSASLENCAAI